MEEDPIVRVTCSSLVMTVVHTIRSYPRRMIVSAVLIFSQAFFFNSLYYKYPLILADHGVPQEDGTQPHYLVGKYMIQLSIVSFLGPLFFGKLFDTVGRRIMCLLTCNHLGLCSRMCGSHAHHPSHHLS